MDAALREASPSNMEPHRPHFWGSSVGGVIRISLKDPQGHCWQDSSRAHRGPGTCSAGLDPGFTDSCFSGNAVMDPFGSLYGIFVFPCSVSAP